MVKKIKGNVIIKNDVPDKKKDGIYNDLLHKPLTQVGDTVEATMKFVALPFKFLGMTSEELEKRYRSFISDSINKIPKDKIAQPSPLIAAKILDNVKYSFNENDLNLTKMFSDLLSSSMNQDTQKYIHPSYVDNLSNMNYIDAYICQFLFKNRIMLKSSFSVPICPVSYNKEVCYISAMQPTRSISYDNYSKSFGIDINDAQLNLSLSFLKSIDVISINKELFSNTDEYMHNIKTMLSRYHEYEFSHKSGFLEYIFNNYQNKEIDFQYPLENAISFIPRELGAEMDQKFCELEAQKEINYLMVHVNRTTVKLTDYGSQFLEKCIQLNRTDVLSSHNAKDCFK